MYFLLHLQVYSLNFTRAARKPTNIYSPCKTYVTEASQSVLQNPECWIVRNWQLAPKEADNLPPGHANTVRNPK